MNRKHEDKRKARKLCFFSKAPISCYTNKNYLCGLESEEKGMEQISILKELIDCGEVDKAIEQITLLLENSSPGCEKDTLYYLRGNAFRKKGDWKGALDNYQYAIDLNPDSPAAEARKMVIEILNFYHKDMYNQ